MSEMLLLGAGASVEAGVPGAYTMTARIVANLRANPQFRKYGHTLSYVVGGLLFQAGKNDLDPLEPVVNVEDLFNAVQLLAERDALEAAPFIGSWHSFVEELDKIHPSQPSGSLQKIIYEAVSKEILGAFSQNPPSDGARNIDSALASTIKKTMEAAGKNRSPSLNSSDSVGGSVERYIRGLTNKWKSKIKSPSLSGSDAIDKQIKGRIRASQALSGKGRVFHETNELMVAALKDLVWIEDANKVSYLVPVLNALQSQGRLVVATLNYDNSVELMASSQSVQYQTGIEEWTAHGRFEVSGPGLHLLKLHGSIDWLREYDEDSSERLPTVTIRQLRAQEVKQLDLRPAVIFGSRNKLTAEGPFLDLLRAFQDELARSQTLTVIGYSFRDPHINVYISQWLNGDINRRLRIVNGPNFNAGLRWVADTSDYVSRLIEFASANPNRVELVPEYAGSGLLTLYGMREATIVPPTTPSQTVLERLAQEVEATEEIENESNPPSNSGVIYEQDSL